MNKTRYNGSDDPFFMSIFTSLGKRTALYSIMYMVGIGIGTVLSVSALILWISCVLLIIVRMKKGRTRYWWVVVWLIIGISHITWIQKTEPVLLDQALGRQEIAGIVTREVEYRTTKQRVVINYKGEDVLLWLPRHPHVQIGDQIHTECNLTNPEPFDDFAYDKYLKTQRIFYQCDWAQEFDIITQGTTSVHRTIFVFKSSLGKRMQKILPEPHASFLAGILYGDRGGLSQAKKDAFATTGTSHILAISGYNITIVTVTLLILLTSALVPRKKAIWIVLLSIALFTIFVGSQASIMRAAIMGIVPLFARMIGRLTKPIFVLIHAATIMVIINPYILIYDPGFQLSVAATAGLLLLTPKFLKQSEWIPEAMDMRQTAVATCAAIIATLPLMLYHFGKLSVASLPVNILILPLMPLIMATGMLTIIATLIHPIIGMLAGAVPYLLISYVLFVIDVASKIPGAALSIPFNETLLVLSYIGLFWLFSKRKIVSKQCVIEKEVWTIQEM